MAIAYVSARDPRISTLLSTRNAPPRTLLAEGEWAHRCLLDAGGGIEVFVQCSELLGADGRELARAAGRRARAAFEVSAKTFARISRRNRGSGLASLVCLPDWRAGIGTVGGRSVGPDTVVLVADGIEYASNLGALVRVVDGSGADALILTSRRARIENPEVFTASRGTVLTTPVVDMGSPGRAAEWLARHGFAVYLALPGAERHFRDRPRGGRPTAIVVGSEGNGVAPAWREVPHEPVSIPMLGRADSLNVAVAAGVLLFG